MRRAPTDAELVTWFGSGVANLGLVCGGGFAVVDFDDMEVAIELERRGLLEGFPTVATPRPGLHAVVRERRPSKSGPVLKGVVDVKAEGGLIVAPPSIVNEVPYKTLRAGKPPVVENAAEWARGLLAIIGRAPPPKPAPSSGVARHASGWVAEALRDLHEGSRNETLTRVAGRLRTGGFDAEDIIGLLAPHAAGCGFPDTELLRLAESVCRYPRGSSSSPLIGEATTTFEVVHARDLLAKPPKELDWQVEGLIHSASRAILSGPAGWGKTWLLLDLCLEVARGGKWLGQFAAKAGRVLYLDQEAGEHLMVRRLHQLMRGKGLAAEDAPDLCFSFFPGLNLSSPESVATLRAKLAETRPALVVVDSLIRSHRADENSATEIAEVFEGVTGLMREFGTSFLFADHQKKPPAGAEPRMDVLLRGSTDKTAAVDTLLSLRKSRDTLLVHHTKSRYSVPQEEFGVAVEDVAGGATVVKWLGVASAIEDEDRLSEVEEKVEHFLREQGDWISRVKLLARFRSLKEKPVDEALKNLGERGRVDREERPSPRGGRAAFFRAALSSPTHGEATTTPVPPAGISEGGKAKDEPKKSETPAPSSEPPCDSIVAAPVSTAVSRTEAEERAFNRAAPRRRAQRDRLDCEDPPPQCGQDLVAPTVQPPMSGPLSVHTTSDAHKPELATEAAPEPAQARPEPASPEEAKQ